jgi:hypothetical protein
MGIGTCYTSRLFSFITGSTARFGNIYSQKLKSFKSLLFIGGLFRLLKVLLILLERGS